MCCVMRMPWLAYCTRRKEEEEAGRSEGGRESIFNVPMHSPFPSCRRHRSRRGDGGRGGGGGGRAFSVVLVVCRWGKKKRWFARDFTYLLPTKRGKVGYAGKKEREREEGLRWFQHERWGGGRRRDFSLPLFVSFPPRTLSPPFLPA